MSNDKVTELLQNVVDDHFEKDKPGDAIGSLKVENVNDHATVNSASNIEVHNHYGQEIHNSSEIGSVNPNDTHNTFIELLQKENFTIITAHKNNPIKKEAIRCHDDDSVVNNPKQSQFRRVIKPRKRFTPVDVESMTPKEHDAFLATKADGTPLWDGIERRHGAYDYSPWNWDRDCLCENYDPEVACRRAFKDRRVAKHKRIAGERRVNPYGQRHIDITSLYIHRFLVVSMSLIMLCLGAFAYIDYNTRDTLHMFGMEIIK